VSISIRLAIATAPAGPMNVSFPQQVRPRILPSKQTDTILMLCLRALEIARQPFVPKDAAS
jgi:hypothetical protein